MFHLMQLKLKVKESYNSNIKQGFIYGSAVFATEFIGYFFFGLMSTRCLYNFKKKYFSTILSQEQAWFDSVNIYEFATKIQTQLEYIEQGMGDVIMDTIISKIFLQIGSHYLIVFVIIKKLIYLLEKIEIIAIYVSNYGMHIILLEFLYLQMF